MLRPAPDLGLDHPVPAARRSAPQGLIAPLLALVYALAFVDRTLVAVAGGPIKADLNLTDTQFGLLGGTAFALLFCLGAVPLGWLADRTDRRRLIATGILAWSAMTALCGLAPDFQTFILAR
ncbi:MAG TPA: MFS transporter, partial [Magnetospirillaceae bacterium]|nr:MFS transporter [Magnetospirillaceae bacterium]